VIVCANCKQTNMAGSVFCSECGSALIASEAANTQNIETVSAGRTARPKHPPPAVPAPPSDNWATLHLLDTGRVLPLTEHNEFTMGRSIEGQSMIPDVDLSPYDAYARGVSRLHAVIKREIGQVVLVDLDSANGTFINGRRLTPKEDHVLANGDVIALGKLKIQILLKAS
jgi:hypothetical protein